MRRYMLDTDTCIYALKHEASQLRGRFNRLADQICVSAVTLAELAYGAEKSRRPDDNRKIVDHFVSQLEVLPFDSRAALHFGDIRAALERGGRPAGGYDLMIGAHARSEALVLVTNNVREFGRMSGLRIESWVN